MPPLIPFLGYVAAGTAVAVATQRATNIVMDAAEGGIRGAVDAAANALKRKKEEKHVEQVVEVAEPVAS